MKLPKFIFVFFLYFFFNINTANSNTSTVFIDIDFILNNSILGKQILLDLEELNKKNIDNIREKENTLKIKRDKINSQKNILSKEQIEKDIVLLNEEFKKYNIEKNNLLNDFKNQKKQKLDNFLKKINPLIQEYMKKNSIDIILDQRQIFIGNVNKDITEKILTIVNQKFSNNG